MTLTREQQIALEALFVPPPSATDEFLQTWLGVSTRDVRTSVFGLLQHKDKLEARVRAWAERNPLDTAFQFVGAAAWAFYAAEKGANPKINTYVDAFYYISTCASVGYADIFAVTQIGRAIAAVVMLVGPALAARSLDTIA